MKRKPIKAEHYGCRFSVIYEVFPKNEKLEIIEWNDNEYGLRENLGHWIEKGVEVIGNIYKNPELLK